MNLQVTVEKCNKELRSTCKSEKEIEEFLKGKYLVTVENNWKYNQDEYSTRRIEPYSKFRWIAVSPY